MIDGGRPNDVSNVEIIGTYVCAKLVMLRIRIITYSIVSEPVVEFISLNVSNVIGCAI